MGMRRRFRQRHLRHRHRFPTAGVMLADEEFVISELVGISDQFDVAVESQ
jgi:hypothetical protein